MKSVTAVELKQMMDDGQIAALIDVREPFEVEVASIDGINIPMAKLEQHLDQIPKEGTVVIHCRSGARSANAIIRLEALGYTNLYNLQGGILGWSDTVDATVAKY
jgi:rhodanese-related sulfurtransferase